MVSNIFGNGNDKLQTEFKEKVDTQSKAILTVFEKQKDVESSVDLLKEKLDLLDHNSIKNIKKIFNDIKSIRGELRELKSDINEIKEFNTKVQKQLNITASKDDVNKLDKYIDLWQPMDFVTRTELEQFRKKITKDLEKIVERFMK
ncbi:MAG: hypothetical protein ACOC16_04115 [Nanoarchaeota archaeon]